MNILFLQDICVTFIAWVDILAPPTFLQSVTYDQVGSDFQQNYDLEVGQYMFKSDILDHNSLGGGRVWG